MKRILRVLIIYIGICFVFNFIAQPLPGNDMDRFEIKADGTVTIDGKVFASLSRYVESDYFKTMGKRCGTRIRSKRGGPLASTGDCTLSRTVIQNEYWPDQTYTIPVVFHIIHKTDGTGNISDQRIHDQVEVLNEDYRAIAGSLGEKGFDSKIQFTLAGITRTANNLWYNDSNELAYKSALGWDQDRYLNIYVNSAGGYLGYAYLPQDNVAKVYDGVVLLYESVGGRNNGFDEYNQGRTAVHEVGHYLGLLHTFEGYGCFTGYNAGDLIADTHSESDEHYGCSQTNTCGTPDDIHNYLNYTDDICMYEFTAEQANRMICSLINYRPLLFQSTQSSITVISPNGGENWDAGSTHSIVWTSTGSVGNVKIQYSLNNGSSWSTITSSTANDGAYSWKLPTASSSQCLVRIMAAATGTPSDTSNAVFSIVSGGSSALISLNRAQLYFTAVRGGSQTGAQQVWLSNIGSGTLNWYTNISTSWLACTPTAGTGAGVLTVSVNPSGLSVGAYIGKVTVTDINAANSPQTVTVTLTVKNASQDQPPFGNFSTPLSGSTVRGSIPVTGWALDDVEVNSVKIYNGSGYLGDAVFVENARPDVEQAYPGYPKNYRAGWGYALLTNFLPNGGNGTYTLYARAIDSGGHQVTLGSKTINIDNNNAVKPFGTLDTPTQGGTASGSSFVNWGWVLTPQPNTILKNGSTIDVWVNGVNLGHPTYNLYRTDIANLFPGYANSNGAVGYFHLDTTAYKNGVHTIYWTAKDNSGNTDGIGSRYFTVQNTNGNRQSSDDRNGREQACLFRESLSRIPADFSDPVEIIKGYETNSIPQTIYPDENGNLDIQNKEWERMEIHLGSPGWRGFLVIGDRFRALPTGSTMNSKEGVFNWQPGTGFIGKYQLIFIDKNSNRLKKINITIIPKYFSK